MKRITIEKEKINSAISAGKKVIIEELMETPSGINDEIIEQIKKKFKPETHGLYAEGILIMYYLNLSDLEAWFIQNGMFPMMVNFICEPILDELKKLPGVEEANEDAKKALKGVA